MKTETLKIEGKTDADLCFGIPQSHYYVFSPGLKAHYVATASLGSCSFIVARTKPGGFFAAHVMANQIYTDRDLGWVNLTTREIKEYLTENTTDILVISNSNFSDEYKERTLLKLPDRDSTRWIKANAAGGSSEGTLAVAVKFNKTKKDLFDREKWDPVVTVLNGSLSKLINSQQYMDGSNNHGFHSGRKIHQL